MSRVHSFVCYSSTDRSDEGVRCSMGCPHLFHLRAVACRFLGRLRCCDTPAQGLIGLIGYSYQQVTTSFPEAGLQRTLMLSVLGPEQFGDGWPTGKLFPGAHEWGQSVQKRHMLVCEGSLCFRKLPDVSGPGLRETGRYKAILYQ